MQHSQDRIACSGSGGHRPDSELPYRFGLSAHLVDSVCVDTLLFHVKHMPPDRLHRVLCSVATWVCTYGDRCTSEATGVGQGWPCFT